MTPHNQKGETYPPLLSSKCEQTYRLLRGAVSVHAWPLGCGCLVLAEAAEHVGHGHAPLELRAGRVVNPRALELCVRVGVGGGA